MFPNTNYRRKCSNCGRWVPLRTREKLPLWPGQKVDGRLPLPDCKSNPQYKTHPEASPSTLGLLEKNSLKPGVEKLSDSLHKRIVCPKCQKTTGFCCHKCLDSISAGKPYHIFQSTCWCCEKATEEWPFGKGNKNLGGIWSPDGVVSNPMTTVDIAKPTVTTPTNPTAGKANHPVTITLVESSSSSDGSASFHIKINFKVS
ncbi:hypothetical protein G7Y89_g13266 [Cudoniella acicularis]|uniref:Uncharacterized protein n=1 Tax=Cudoniella acicularis TaxID=354080 RepID=A0A8H4R9N5_9HELO|nr:hypothetical protein G7Y89_g13266 [Cudoniella acicularis]